MEQLGKSEAKRSFPVRRARSPSLDPASRRPRQLLEPRIVEAAVEIFKALGDPTRLRILHLLSQSEFCVCRLAEALAMNPSAVSHQLRLLRTERLVRSRREGRRIYYALDDDHIERLLGEGVKHASHV